MRTRQIIKEKFTFTGKLRDLPAFLAHIKKVVPTKFENV